MSHAADVRRWVATLAKEMPLTRAARGPHRRAQTEARSKLLAHGLDWCGVPVIVDAADIEALARYNRGEDPYAGQPGDKLDVEPCE